MVGEQRLALFLQPHYLGFEPGKSSFEFHGDAFRVGQSVCGKLILSWLDTPVLPALPVCLPGDVFPGLRARAFLSIRGQFMATL